MHRRPPGPARHRPGAELGGQLAEPGRQHRRVLGRRTARPPRPRPGDGARTPAPRWSCPRRPARTTPPPAARRRHPRPAGHPAPPAAPPARPGTPAAAPAAAPGPPPPDRPGPLAPGFASLASSAWTPVLSPWISPCRSLNSAGRTCPGHLVPERGHQRQPLRIGQVGQAHVGDAGAQQRDPRDAALTRPPELQLRDRQALRIVRPRAGTRTGAPRSARTGHTRRHHPGSCPARCRCRAGNCRPPGAAPAAASPAPPAVPRSGRRSWTTHRPWPTPAPQATIAR